jgi:SAM-dependent methyltransferase
VAFDVAETAVRVAQQRHPGTSVEYVTADLLDPPVEWLRGFDLVVEVFTVQALPDPPRRTAIGNVGRLVAPGGTLIVIAARPEQTGAEVKGRLGRSRGRRSTRSAPTASDRSGLRRYPIHDPRTAAAGGRSSTAPPDRSNHAAGRTPGKALGSADAGWQRPRLALPEHNNGGLNDMDRQHLVRSQGPREAWSVVMLRL